VRALEQCSHTALLCLSCTTHGPTLGASRCRLRASSASSTLLTAATTAAPAASTCAPTPGGRHRNGPGHAEALERPALVPATQHTALHWALRI